MPRHVKTHMTAHILLISPDAQIKTEQYTEVTADGTNSTHTSLSLKVSRNCTNCPQTSSESTCRRFFAELCEERQGLDRRGRPPKLTLERPTMAENGEAHRTGGSSSSGARSSSIRPESNAVKADPEREWTPVARRRRFQKQDSRSCSSRSNEEVEEHGSDFGHWRQHQDGSEGRRNTKEDAGGDHKRRRRRA